MKISSKKTKTVMFTLDADAGLIRWESKKDGKSESTLRQGITRVLSSCSVLLENIKELRPGAEASSYRLQFRLSAAYEPRWLTIIYTLPPQSSSTSNSSGQVYKQLHIVAFTEDVFDLWLGTLMRLCELRRELMSGLGKADERELLWDRGIWRGADVGSVPGAVDGGAGPGAAAGDEKLSLGEVEVMCARLGVRISKSDLEGLFKV